MRSMDGLLIRRGSLHPISFAVGFFTAGLACLGAATLLYTSGTGPFAALRAHCETPGMDLHALGSALGDAAQGHGDRLPVSLEMLETPDETGRSYLESLPDDPWGRDYVYEPQVDGSARLGSLGADGLAHTGDDITFVIERGPAWVVREATRAELEAERR
jgi:Type II secretion system (T2SS), protein G